MTCSRSAAAASWRRPTAITTGPIFPNRAKDMAVDGPNQLWVADITYVAIAGGFVYVAVILDAWSRRGRRLCHRPLDRRAPDGRCAASGDRTAKAAAGCIHHSDRGSQYAAEIYRELLAAAWPDRLDGAARQSLRQRQGGELHEDAEGRGGLPDGLRDLRRRRREPSALHQRGLQQPHGSTRPSAT